MGIKNLTKFIKEKCQDKLYFQLQNKLLKAHVQELQLICL